MGLLLHGLERHRVMSSFPDGCLKLEEPGFPSRPANSKTRLKIPTKSRWAISKKKKNAISCIEHSSVGKGDSHLKLGSSLAAAGDISKTNQTNQPTPHSLPPLVQFPQPKLRLLYKSSTARTRVPEYPRSNRVINEHWKPTTAQQQMKEQNHSDTLIQ